VQSELDRYNLKGWLGRKEKGKIDTRGVLAKNVWLRRIDQLMQEKECQGYSTLKHDIVEHMTNNYSIEPDQAQEIVGRPEIW
jgi:hypothetical protein